MLRKPFTIYRRVASAFLLPLASVALCRTVYASALYDVARQHPVTTWLVWGVMVCVAALEVHYLAVLSRFARAGCRLDRFVSLELDPVEIIRRRRLKFRWAAIGLGMLAALAVGEAVFRVFEIRPPPIAVDTHRVDDSLNALGIREEWDSLLEDDGRLRVAFLGDSFVYGYAVEREETFCHLVEGLLAADDPDGVVTISMGWPATSPGSQRRRYLPLREILHPHVVVHVVYPNDLGEHVHELLRRLYRIRDGELRVASRSYLLRYVEHRIRQRLAWQYTFDYFRGGCNARQRAASLATFKTEVRACKAAVEEGGAVYALVLFPWLFGLDDYPLEDLHAAIRTFAEELDVPYLDLLGVMAACDADSLRVNLANEHPNAKGHRLAADRIARFLREEVLVKLGDGMTVNEHAPSASRGLSAPEGTR